MQVLALVSEQKSLRKEFDLMQSTQLKELVVSYVTSQLESLNISQMKTDFNDFYERIKRVEAEML
jgi:hypothetical protein